MENVMNLLMGFSTVFSFENLGVCLLGSVLGLIVGAMPGIGSLAGSSTTGRAARYGFLSLRSWKSFCSASPTPAAASRRSISAVSSSPSSGWTSLAAGNTVAQDWGSHWYGRSPTSTAAPFGWRKARRRALPLRWSCRQGRKTIPPARISHNSPRRFHDDRFSTSTMLSQQLSISSLSWVITRMVLPLRTSLSAFLRSGA